MRARRFVVFPVMFICLSLYSHAQLWSGILAPARAIDWSTIGAGAIPTNRTQCGATIAAYSGNPNTIADAINACEANTYVGLGAGTFNLNGSIYITNSNVTLRGVGPGQTVLRFSSAGVCAEAHPGAICVAGGTDIDSFAPDNVASFSGFKQGETTLNLGTQTVGSHKPAVGDVLILNQDMDASNRAADTWPEVFQCLAGNNVCTQASNGPADYGDCGSGPCWGQFQVVQVTSITAGTCTTGSPCTVGINPPLHMPNWGLRPTRVWWSNSPSVVGVGIENLRITGPAGTLGFRFAAKSWAKNIQIDNGFGGGAPHYIILNHTTQVTIRDSYLVGQFDWSIDEYLTDCYACSSTLFENNILEGSRNNFGHEMGEGNVYSYNYHLDNLKGTNNGNEFGTTWNHGIGAAYLLSEGNDGFGINLENYFGSAMFSTTFRNRFYGNTSHDQSGNTGGLTPINIWGLSRFPNVIGNVLGTAGFHTHYQKIPGDGQDGTYGNLSIYCLGMGNDCQSSGVPDDTHLVASTMRWGNWDAVNNAVQWNSSEVPSGLAKYANAVPANHILPASFIYNSAPSWWGVIGQAAIPWPAIGPDVTNGNLANSAGFANTIPARVCFESVMGGSFADTTPRTFDANKCYSQTTSTSPAPPTGLSAVVQ